MPSSSSGCKGHAGIGRTLRMAPDRGTSHLVTPPLATPARHAWTCLLVWLLAASAVQLMAQPADGYGPGRRVLLDAHNAYPYEGRFSDRIDRGLSTGLPVAIEQDLIWRAGADGGGVSVVAHDVEHAGDAPTFETYFFERIRPLMERALAEDARHTWPVVVLNLDFKTTEPAHLDAVWATLGKYSEWLTTAPRTTSPERAEPMAVGPLLVLTGASAEQAVRFHDAVEPGQALRVFGAIDVPSPPGDDAEARARALASMSPEVLIASRSTNYRRWVNFPWGVVEAGGPPQAGDWTQADAARLQALVSRAHAQALWIRFYTLNGHAPEAGLGWYDGYNFGSEDAAKTRWRAARAAGVDFTATDQYEAYSEARADRRTRPARPLKPRA